MPRTRSSSTSRCPTYWSGSISEGGSCTCSGTYVPTVHVIIFSQSNVFPNQKLKKLNIKDAFTLEQAKWKNVQKMVLCGSFFPLFCASSLFFPSLPFLALLISCSLPFYHHKKEKSPESQEKIVKGGGGEKTESTPHYLSGKRRGGNLAAEII